MLWATPAHRHAVVAAAPDDEGNGVEMVRALAAHMRVYWLVGDPPETLRWLVADVADASRIRIVSRTSATAYLAYLTARYIFFTHGLYGSPLPPPHKTVVNLWHGDGPKARKRFAQIRSSALVAGTELWGNRRPELFSMPRCDVLITGNPRVDQFRRPTDEQTLRSLGLSPDRPLVLWLPTYRRTAFRGRRIGAVRNWADTDGLSWSSQTVQFAGLLDETAHSLGITVALKAHHLDADDYQDTGLRVLTRSDLMTARTTLYQLLAVTNGLVTDYSSVWTDYLCLDRPVGFFCPDLDEYELGRGLNVTGYREILPGPLLSSAEQLEEFLQDCCAESPTSRERRHRSAATIGAQLATGASDRLLQALGIAPVPSHPLVEPRFAPAPGDSLQGVLDLSGFTYQGSGDE
jgi:hypothetical protein